MRGRLISALVLLFMLPAQAAFESDGAWTAGSWASMSWADGAWAEDDGGTPANPGAGDAPNRMGIRGARIGL